MTRSSAGVLLLSILLALSVPFSLAAGSVRVPVSDLVSVLTRRADADPGTVAIIWKVRFPRVVVSLMVGGSLALAGAAMQGLFRNPMASPDLLGVSAGGSLGAVVAIATGLAASSRTGLMVAALSGSVVAAVLAYAIATGRQGTSLFFLILAGLAISSFFNGMISGVLLMIREHALSQYLFWTMGGLEGRRWDHVTAVGPVMALATIGVLLFRNELNLLMVGEEGAHALGLSVESTKRLLLLFAAVLTGSAVSVSGTIGFVGLLVPHLLRLVLGPDHRRLLPASLLGGALFLTVCDTIARTFFGPFELRVGIVTALLGAPYLVFLILRYRGSIRAVPFG